MRHSRKAVMAERYKIYLKKNIINGKYFKRNLEIAVCFVAVVALVVGLFAVGNVASEDKTVTANANVSVKDALFGNSEDTKTVAKEENTEAVATSEETKAPLTDVEVAQTPTISDYIQMSNEYKEAQENKSEFEGKCIANVEETLNIRKNPSTDAEFAGSMVPGAIAIVEGTEGEWTKIKSGDVEGYVLSEFILTGESAEEFAANYVTLRGTALEDGVNVREDKSTDANILLVLNKDDTITVLEKPEEKKDTSKEEKQQENSEESTTQTTTMASTSEATTEKVTETSTELSTQNSSEASTQNTSENSTEQTTQQDETTETTTDTTKNLSQSKGDATTEVTWVPVMLEDGKTGYVSAQFIEIEELYEIAVSAEELERLAEEEAARKAAEEEAARQAAEAASQSNNNSSNGGSTNNNDSYQGATTTPVTTAEPGDLIGTFTITAYCGCSKCSGGHSKTASGTTPTEGRTIAADTSILPFGTQVVIGGVVYTVEDRGSGVSGNHIDIFFATHERAMAFGRKSIKVYKY